MPSANSISFPQDGYTGVIAGWGETVQNGNESEIINNARINIYSSKDCENFGYSNATDWKTQFCAGNGIKKKKEVFIQFRNQAFKYYIFISTKKKR